MLGMNANTDDEVVQDLHDGAGLSDATSPNGVLSNPIFEVSLRRLGHVRQQSKGCSQKGHLRPAKPFHFNGRHLAC